MAPAPAKRGVVAVWGGRGGARRGRGGGVGGGVALLWLVGDCVAEVASWRRGNWAA